MKPIQHAAATAVITPDCACSLKGPPGKLHGASPESTSAANRIAGACAVTSVRMHVVRLTTPLHASLTQSACYDVRCGRARVLNFQPG